MFQSREDRTAIIIRHCSCYGLSLATDDFKLSFLPLHSVLKILPGKNQLHSETKETGDWILCHFQSATIQHFFLVLAFYFHQFCSYRFREFDAKSGKMH